MPKKQEFLEYEDGSRVLLDEDDSPEWTEEMFAKSETFSSLPDNIQEGLSGLRKRGRPRAENPKQLISFRLSSDIVEHLKKDVEGYNIRIEHLIRQAWQEGRI